MSWIVRLLCRIGLHPWTPWVAHFRPVRFAPYGTPQELFCWTRECSCCSRPQREDVKP